MVDANGTSIDSVAYSDGKENDVGIAFAMVCIAGAASMIGFLAVVFLKKSNTVWLSIGLAFAAGLMIFVSLVEILVEGCIGSFEAAGYSEGASIRYAVLLFYAGCTLVYVFDKATQMATPYANLSLQMATRSFQKIKRSFRGKKQDIQMADEEKDLECPPDGILGSGLQDMSSCPPRASTQGGGCLSESEKVNTVGCDVVPKDADRLCPEYHLQKNEKDLTQTDEAELRKVRTLQRMSLLVAVSMAIHNFPEGMAVFLGALKNSNFGATIAIAISIHNIPEGFCISMPVYYATGSRLKAFFWTLIPSLAEPLGGLIAYLAFRDAGDLAFAIAFGIVAGIMVYISVMELLPAAFSFDPSNRYTTWSVLAGMSVMAFSFILLSI